MRDCRLSREASLLVVSMAVVAVCLLAALATWTPFDPTPQQNQDRFGVCVSPRYGALEDFATADLHFGWYYD